MAINNTNVLNTKLGLSIDSAYIRLEIYLGVGKQTVLSYQVYADKDAYIESGEMINNVIDFDFSNLTLVDLSGADVTLDNLHDLAINELVERGLDASKLAKVDL